MVKILLLIIILSLTGCSAPKIAVTSNVKPIAVPILYSPAPPIISRPDLPHLTIASTDLDGMVVLKYYASIEALIGYSEQLETALKQYQTIHDSYATLASQVASDWKAKTGTDLILPEQPQSNK